MIWIIAGSGPDSVPRRLLRRPGRAAGRVPETAGRQPEDAITVQELVDLMHRLRDARR